jgi:hypothetical protein
LQRDRQIDREGRFAHSAFVAANRDDSCLWARLKRRGEMA